MKLTKAQKEVFLLIYNQNNYVVKNPNESLTLWVFNNRTQKSEKVKSVTFMAGMLIDSYKNAEPGKKEGEFYLRHSFYSIEEFLELNEIDFEIKNRKLIFP